MVVRQSFRMKMLNKKLKILLKKDMEWNPTLKLKSTLISLKKRV